MLIGSTGRLFGGGSKEKAHTAQDATLKRTDVRRKQRCNEAADNINSNKEENLSPEQETLKEEYRTRGVHVHCEGMANRSEIEVDENVQRHLNFASNPVVLPRDRFKWLATSSKEGFLGV